MALMNKWKVVDGALTASPTPTPNFPPSSGEDNIPLEDSGSDTELDELDAKAEIVKGIGSARSTGEENPGENFSQEKLAARLCRRSLRASRRSLAELLTRTRVEALGQFKASVKATASYRRSFPGIPTVLHGDRGVYALRCWYIRKGAPTISPTDPVLHCVYYRVLMLRSCGTLLACTFPGELPEALRFLSRALAHEREESRGEVGGEYIREVVRRPCEDSFAEWGPHPSSVVGLGNPSPPGDTSALLRGPQEKGVVVAAAAAPLPMATTALGEMRPPSHHRRPKREERGDRTVGRGIWKVLGSRLEAEYVTGGHRIRTHWDFNLVSFPSPSMPDTSSGDSNNPGAPFAYYSRVGKALTVEGVRVGDAGGGDMTAMESLVGEVFHWYPINAGVQGLP